MSKYLTRKLAACLLVFVSVLSLGIGSALVAPGVAHAQVATPVCAILDQGQVACPGGTKFPGKTGECYYEDLGDPQGGNVPNFPGWVKADCSADIFKEALCVAGKVDQNPQCKTIGESSDKALHCPATDCDLTKKYVDPLINALAALVGVVITGSIIWGGIQYASSADDPQKVSQAKSRIMNSLVALAAFFFLYAFLQWLIPGGSF